MAAFFPDILEGFPQYGFLLEVCKKFHYEEERLPELRAVAEEMLSFMRGEAFWERKKTGMLNGTKMQENNAVPEYEEVVMSLGGGIDILQENYHKNGLLSESYMLEALASELLIRAYGAYNRHVKENSDFDVARYHFPGNEEDFPLEMLPAILKNFHCRLSCNTAFCISPKKSVVFLAELTKDENVQCESICMGCRNLQCDNRIKEAAPGGCMTGRMADLFLNYGYSRIFGK